MPHSLLVPYLSLEHPNLRAPYGPTPPEHERGGGRSRVDRGALGVLHEGSHLGRHLQSRRQREPPLRRGDDPTREHVDEGPRERRRKDLAGGNGGTRGRLPALRQVQLPAILEAHAGGPPARHVGPAHPRHERERETESGGACHRDVEVVEQVEGARVGQPPQRPEGPGVEELLTAKAGAHVPREGLEAQDQEVEYGTDEGRRRERSVRRTRWRRWGRLIAARLLLCSLQLLGALLLGVLLPERALREELAQAFLRLALRVREDPLRERARPPAAFGVR